MVSSPLRRGSESIKMGVRRGLCGICTAEFGPCIAIVKRTHHPESQKWPLNGTNHGRKSSNVKYFRQPDHKCYIFGFRDEDSKVFLINVSGEYGPVTSVRTIEKVLIVFPNLSRETVITLNVL